MSALSKLEQLEEYAGELGATSDDLFTLWFANHAPESLQERVAALRSWPEYESEPVEKLVLWMLRDVVGQWIEEAETEHDQDDQGLLPSG